MSVKSPHTTQVERGGYSAILYKDGDLTVADDELGNTIKENTDAAAVIQAAIDSCDLSGKVILTDVFDTTAELTFPCQTWPNFTSGITLQGYGNKTGINYTPTTGYALKLHGNATYGTSAFHILDNFLIKAPNTNYAAVGLLGGVWWVTLRNLKIDDCPNAKGLYIDNEIFGNNILSIYDLIIYDCKWGLYASGGPSIYLTHGRIATGASGVGFEALYYTVDGYTEDGYKQLHTTDLELVAEVAAQRSMYIKGDKDFFSSHQNMYDDMARPIYLDSGRHAFSGCYLGDLDWTIGTQVTMDQACRGGQVKGDDPMFGYTELQTPFRIDSNSPFMNVSGTKVADSNAANGYCVQLDAQGEQCSLSYNQAWMMYKGIGCGKYLLTLYAKDSNQVANDMQVRIKSDEGGTHFLNTKTFTLTSAYNAIPYSFTLAGAADVGTTIIIEVAKSGAATNIVSIDYLTLQHIGADFHQSLGGGHQFLYLPDGGTLPLASSSFRGIIAFQPGAGSVADTMKMCMKSAADTYSWTTVVTG